MNSEKIILNKRKNIFKEKLNTTLEMYFLKLLNHLIQKLIK